MRRPGATVEPAPKPAPKLALVAAPLPARARFCVQEHRARRLHYDFRLEMGGVLKSWALPKGPSLDPELRRLAVATDDHALDYLTFEGRIGKGGYGAGEVLVWDLGDYELAGEEPPLAQWRRGEIKFVLHGSKLRGEFALVRLRPRASAATERATAAGAVHWLMIKKRDAFARFGDTAAQHPGSALRPLNAVADPPAPDASEAGAKPASAPLPHAPGTELHQPDRGEVAGKGLRNPVVRPSAGGQRPGRGEAQAMLAAPAQPQPRAVRRREAGLGAYRDVRDDGRPTEPALAQSQPGRDDDAARRASPRPDGTEPMLATLGDRVFSEPGWFYEIKWDGIRAFARCRNGAAQLISRNRRDLTPQYPELARAPFRHDALLDGEIVALEPDGRSSFERLQQRMNLANAADVVRAAAKIPVVYYAFDLLWLDGRDLTRLPLRERKAMLVKLALSGSWRYSDHVERDGIGLFQLARRRGLEGVMAKRADSPYTPGRGRDWIKFKVQHQQEFAVVGYTDPQGSRTSFGALVLAVYDPKAKRFIYVGRVGTGFDASTRRHILAQLRRRKTPAITGAPGKYHPVTPKLVAEVRFAEWTNASLLRAPVFLGLRTDKSPKQCLREVPNHAPRPHS